MKKQISQSHAPMTVLLKLSTFTHVFIQIILEELIRVYRNPDF